MAKSLRLLLVFGLVMLPGVSRAGGSRMSVNFDGKWLTKITCPAKGKAAPYAWQFPAVVTDGSFHGEHGNEGDPDHLIIEGKIAANGAAKLTARGLAAAKTYSPGRFANEVPDSSYKIRAQFKDEDGTGTREGILDAGQACTFEFVRQHTDTPEQ